MKQLVLVFIGGGTGSIARYVLGKVWNTSTSGIPYGTLTANILGSLIIGIVLGWAIKNETLSSNTTLLLATGFCGGFTTFSTFAYENHNFLKIGDLLPFAIYAIASFTIGILAVFGGMWIGKVL
ncbi:fluoride efflux transporter CrcB [Dokdonia ponticola]|uniref:Fluoride-specific ion channel FluC n=1 Tax=Dokdonia ponticola TaxID=2041041 RepID=A0ABV9HQ42_9FLAO